MQYTLGKTVANRDTIGPQGLANYLLGRFDRTILSTAPNGHPPLGATFPEDSLVTPWIPVVPSVKYSVVTA